MNIRARSTFRAGSFARLEAAIVPKLIKAVEGGTQAVFQLSQEKVHVDTGELKASGHYEVDWKGMHVQGTITYDAKHAGYNEFGTGRRGAASPGAGPYSYNADWPGMAAIPFMRPALTEGRPQIKAAFQEQGFTI